MGDRWNVHANVVCFILISYWSNIGLINNIGLSLGIEQIIAEGVYVTVGHGQGTHIDHYLCKPTPRLCQLQAMMTLYPPHWL